MPPLLVFLARRVITIPITLLVVTALLYAIVMLIPVTERASIYVAPSFSIRTAEAAFTQNQRDAIRRYRLDEPYPIQYTFWLGQLVTGNWGYSPNLNDYVLTALLRRTPATIELLLYAALLYFPLGIIAGVIAGWRRDRPLDGWLRLGAFIGTSIPVFVLAFAMLGIFYVGLRWFSPDRVSPQFRLELTNGMFPFYTGMLTIDSLINRRWDIFVDAWRHLAMPIISLAFVQWATVMRVTRVSMIEALDMEYIVAARARGVRLGGQLWKHALRNALIPVLTNSILSAATLISGVFIIERIFDYPGVSEILTKALEFQTPDVAAVLGFTVYSILLVLPLMVLMELLQAVIDPRVREGVAS